ncbi:MAG: hypothetical protein WD688_21335 [Candidatus Binatia bacterium]
MSEPFSPLLLQFLAWVSSRRRTYDEAMEAWQSTCPRHTVWEDAIIDGLIQVKSTGPLHPSHVTLTPKGKTILDGNSYEPADISCLAGRCS